MLVYGIFFGYMQAFFHEATNMKKIFTTMVSLILCGLLFTACQSVPLTGRKQLALIPQSQMMTSSARAYDAFIGTAKIIHNTPEARMVQRVGTRIQHAVERYMEEHQLSHQLKGYEWHYTLVDDEKSPNAFCMPGGKIVVYSGILPLTQDEEGLAAVLGHEVAHEIGQHGSERSSQHMLASLASAAVSSVATEAMTKKSSPSDQAKIKLLAAGFGAAATYGVLLPYSRLHESEADRMGMHFMAMAGYNPQKAVDLWERFKIKTSTEKRVMPEFFSTHPSDDTRIARNKATLPEVISIYRANLPKRLAEEKR